MKRFTTILLALAVALWSLSAALAKDSGNHDVLRLTNVAADNGEFKVAVQVINDVELAGLDIPIRFGIPGEAITLDRVEWTKRVADWDFTHAAIDNENKTVILGLISELTQIRTDADLKTATSTASEVAYLVFKLGKGVEPSFTTFRTEAPGHSLTYIYNRYEAGKPVVESITPELEINLNSDAKASQLPTEFALSQNYPNPFNPSTSFVLSLKEESDYSVRVFNVAGQLVRTFDGHAQAGNLTLTWDGTSNQGQQVASGVYFYRADAKSFSQTRKMMMLK